MDTDCDPWEDGVLSPREVQEILDLGEKTVARMADRGELRVFRTMGGHRRYSLTDVLDVSEKRRKSRL